MSDYTLCLIPLPYGSCSPPPAELELDGGSHMQAGLLAGPCVYNDFHYTGELRMAKDLPANQIDKIKKFYCNGKPVKINGQQYDESSHIFRFRFSSKNSYGDQLFRDPFGYVSFTVELQEKATGKSQILYTAHIPVYVNERDEASRRICSSMAQMADFIFNNCEPFWQEEQLPAENLDQTPSLVPSGLKPSARQSLEAHIQLLENIVQTYEKVLPFFRTDSRYRIRPEKQWVNFERASRLGSDTFHGILQQPHHLMPTGQGGIRVPGLDGAYLPGKVIAAAGQIDPDIYENQYVVGFLRYLLDRLAGISEALQKRLKQVAPPDESKPMSGYVNSVYFIHGSMPQRLREDGIRLQAIKRKIFGLYTAYHQLLPTIPVQAQGSNTPRPTAIFRSVHHYREIYELACQWFRFGVYDFRQEDMLLPFVEGHKLYEYYALIKLLCCLRSRDFVLDAAATFQRPWEETNSVRSDLFRFHQGGLKLTVFYGPQIYGRGAPENLPELELYRNNSINYRGGKTSGCDLFYAPDYVIKAQKGNGPANYVILDAKFSDLNTAQDFRMPELAYKYLLSLSASHPERGDRILGLCLLYGKPSFQEKQDMRDLDQPVINGYDLAGELDVRPFIRLVALRPENEAVHDAALSSAVSLKEFW